MHPLIETTNHIANISCELDDQDEQWGPQNHSIQTWMILLVEEIGELAQEINNITDCPPSILATQAYL